MKILRVLAFELPVMKNMAVLKICNEMKIEFKLIKKENMHKTLGFLAGAVGIPEINPEYDISDLNSEFGELLVFAGFNTQEIEAFLDKYKKCNVPKVKYKAMLTEYNALWSLAFLYKELKKEEENLCL